MKATKKSNSKLKVKKAKVRDLTVKETNKVIGGLARAGCCNVPQSDIDSPFTK